jgi:D-alanyl-lipoteichoic acid acyltransferase DltB (MBOAT superfamily)
MLLNTFPFFVFFALVFIVYWKIHAQYRWIILLLASYYFFGTWYPAYLGLIILTTAVNYFSALAMVRSGNNKKYFLWLALGIDLAILFIFKYFNFFTFTLAQVLQAGHMTVVFPEVNWLLPLGISFYTFQTIGYMLDVYKGTIKPEKHIGYFALFVCFFPQLAAGPIERAGELLPQIKKNHEFQYTQVVSGLKLFTLGLFKKLVIADNIGIIVDRVFASLPTYKGFSLVVTVILYSWQIYTDFSGYTDMARGVARMLGFDLVENFNLPYVATSVRDFWRRWHMSLSRWFKDYVYIPLGGSRKGLARACVNTLIVFTLCGIWHGASWNFVIWGAFFGFIMAGERIVEKIINHRFTLPRFIAVVYTYAVVCISWVLFRATTLSDAVYIYRNSFVGWKNFISPSYLFASISQLFITNRVEMGITFGLLLLAVCTEYVVRVGSVNRILNKQPTVIRYAVYVLLVLVIVQFRNADIKAFIYARF